MILELSTIWNIVLTLVVAPLAWYIKSQSDEEYISDMIKKSPRISGKLWPIYLNNNKEEECIGVLLSDKDGLYFLKTDRPHKNQYLCLKCVKSAAKKSCLGIMCLMR